MALSGRTKVLRFLEREERSQSWLARRAEVSNVFISLWLSGQRGCSERVAERIARVTGIPKDELTGRAA